MGLVFRAARRVSDGAAILDALLGQLQPVLGVGHLEPHLPQRPLPGEAPILRRLHGGAARLELVLGDARLFARLDELAFQPLHLRRRAAVGIARLAPLLPDDASPQQLQPGAGVGGFPGGCGLGAQSLESGRQLRLQVLEPEEVRRQLLQLLRGLLAPGLDASDLSRLLEQLPAFAG